MKPGFWRCLLPASLALACVGCAAVRDVTQEERAESFQPFEEVVVGPEVIRNHVLRRSALIINGAEFGEIRHSERASISFNLRPLGDFNWGTAAAVDRRGYFVTAAHCIDADGEGVGLAIPTRSGIELRKARVVSMGDASSGVADFALLHVPGKLEHVFAWGDDPGAGDAVISAGVSRDREGAQSSGLDLAFSIDPVGGRIESILGEQVAGVSYQVILHDSPLMRGNSGGPLVSEKGRLLGVNFTGPAAFPIFYGRRHRSANAVRPDLEWLDQVIEQDARSGE